MPYTHTTWGSLKQQLSARLDDVSNTFWVSDEIQVILTETLRTWGLVSGFWRERGVITTASNTPFYDIPTSLTTELVNYTVTDYDIIKAIQYHFLESVASQSVWNGTEMFDIFDFQIAIQRRLNQFLQDTGIILTNSTLNTAAPPVSRFFIPDNIIDIRRMLWIDSDGTKYNCSREDEMAVSFFNLAWSVNPDIPTAYSILATRPLEIQLAPPAVDAGTIEVLTVNTHPNLDTPNTSTILQIFDDLTWILKWGVMADLLGIDGPARDPVRANFCEQRYQQGIMFARLLTSFVHSRIGDVPARPTSVFDADKQAILKSNVRGIPSWENATGQPQDVLFAGWNLVGTNPVPDGKYSITLDVIRKAIIPASDNIYVQVGREQINPILDYAEHLAMFKVGGAEFLATVRQSNDFLLEALSYNARLSASARYIFEVRDDTSRAEKERRPRRINNGIGLGTLPPQQRNA